MLPSPTCAKAIGRIPGSRSQTAALARVTNSATRLTGTGPGEQSHRILDPRQTEKRRLDFARFGKEFDGRGGDDAEGSLRTDEELLQIVAGIVLAQPT